MLSAVHGHAQRAVRFIGRSRTEVAVSHRRCGKHEQRQNHKQNRQSTNGKLAHKKDGTNRPVFSLPEMMRVACSVGTLVMIM